MRSAACLGVILLAATAATGQPPPPPTTCDADLLLARAYLGVLQRQREDLEQALIRTRLDLRAVTERTEDAQAARPPVMAPEPRDAQ